MTTGKASGCLQGKVILRLPMLEPQDTTIPFQGVTVTLRNKATSSYRGKWLAETKTDNNGEFQFDALADDVYKVEVDKKIARDDDSEFHLWGAVSYQLMDVSTGGATTTVTPASAGGCVYVEDFVFTIKFLDQKLINNTAGSIAGIESVLKDMATFPFSGPSDVDGSVHQVGRARRPAVASNGVRSGVTSALADLGITGDLTDDDLARLFPAETDEDGEVSYRWAGPAVATRASARSSGARKPGTVQISGALARFQQKAKVALTEMQAVLATIQPFNGHDVDPRILATQKAIVLQTMQSIVEEPERPDGLRQLAVDLHFRSLLKDKIKVTKGKPPVEGTLGVLKHLLGVSDALISDQDAEAYVTEWHRVDDAVRSARADWKIYKGSSSKQELRFGEQLQKLHGYFGALSEAAEDARSMLRTVRFAPQEQATQEFSTLTGDKVTTDDLLSMVEDLANEIGPTYITDWKGRGIATLAGRATKLRDTTGFLIRAKPDDAVGFPFSNPRVWGAFDDIRRLLHQITTVCNEIAAP